MLMVRFILHKFAIIGALAVIFIFAYPVFAEVNMTEKNLNLKWWQKSIVYQIYPKSFQDTDNSGTGDLPGITQHLDYVKSLGAGAIWISPFYPSPGVDNGYDVSDYVGIDPKYGTMADFEKLIREAKSRDIRIVMDLVFNHTSNQHAWFLESSSSRDNAKADWYIWRDEPTNWRSIFGGSAWTWCESRKQYYLHTFAVEQPDLNWENPEVRKALFDAANFWLSKGVGGFRIDAITYIKKPEKFENFEPDGIDGLRSIHDITANSPGILDFLREFKREVFDGHDIFTVGEANGVPSDELKYWSGEYGVFDMIFEFNVTRLPFAKHGEFWCKPSDWTILDLKNAINSTQQGAKKTWCPVFFENHDEPRSVNHFFPSNADRKKAARALAVMLMTLRGTPFVFQGEELGAINVDWDNIEMFDDLSTRWQYNFALQDGFSREEAMKAVRFFSRDNARTPMQWNSQANAGFTPENVKPWLPVNSSYKFINVESEEQDPESILNFYRELVRFRSQHPELLSGEYEFLLPNDEKIFAYSRAQKIIVAVNLSTSEAELPEEFLTNTQLLLDTESGTSVNPRLLRGLEARIYKLGM